jgi:sodium/potassium-transporting ATPase subunit alpha
MIQPGQGMTVLGWALLGVSILNAVFAFAQDMRAEHGVFCISPDKVYSRI